MKQIKFLIILLLFTPIVSQATETSGMFYYLVQSVNALKAASSRHNTPGYPLSESPGYNHYKVEELRQSKESVQKLLTAGHKYKDKYNRFHNSIPGYPSSEMGKVKMTISDVLGSVAYSDQRLGRLTESLGYKGQTIGADNMITEDARYYMEEHILNLTSFRKLVKFLEPEINSDIFKFKCNIFF